MLEPRFYEKNGEDIIQEQYEEVFEVVFIMNGIVGIGYRLFNEVFYGKSLIMNKQKRTIAPINDYSCIFNKSSEFLYQPVEKTEALAIRREDFFNLMEEHNTKKLKIHISQNYKNVIQEPLHEHREEMATKFELRNDYVDLSAFGVGKVNMLSPKTDNTNNAQKDEFDDMDSDEEGVSSVDEEELEQEVLR